MPRINPTDERESGEGRQESDRLLLAEDSELVADFILESREYLANIGSQILLLERDGPDVEALNSVFRGFHTIKGLAGFLELWDMQTLAHEVETVLDGAREGALIITPDGFDIILQSADYLGRWLTHLEAGLHDTPSQRPETAGALLARIRALYSGFEDILSGDCPAPLSLTSMASMAAAVEGPESAGAPAARRSEEISSHAASIKVATAKLDHLVDMAGELVIAESLVRHDPKLAALECSRLQRHIANLARITADLQKTAMSMRLIPIGPLFRRMERLARDLSRQFGKTVEVETEGDHIELDRTIVEKLADPLMHMVRNAMDHGIEEPAEREEKGKRRAARLLLKAHQRTGQVVVEIRDDGRGLDRGKIVRKAIEKGLIESDEGRTDHEIYSLIFEAGFSTAAHVTNVSGRGVGMDVVRRNVEKLRGRIEIRSTWGQGTSFFLRLPLTLAIDEGLVVGVGRERYIVPLFGVKEMLRPKEDTIWTVQHKAEMALVRGDLLPVIRLYRRFNVQPVSEDPMQSILVIVEVEGKRICLMVDKLIGKQEVVIKGLGETFKDVPGFAGAAILGDGHVGLILDPSQLVEDGLCKEAADVTR